MSTHSLFVLPKTGDQEWTSPPVGPVTEGGLGVPEWTSMMRSTRPDEKRSLRLPNKGLKVHPDSTGQGGLNLNFTGYD